MTDKTPENMAQTAMLRARDERGSVCWKGLVANYVVYGRPRYWRMVDTRIPVGSKAGGFVKSADVKTALDALYAGTAPFVECRASLIQSLDAEDFLKDTVR